MPFFRTGDASLFYLDQGEGHPFVCLHGLGGSHAQPLTLWDDLAGIRLISMDFRGHGQSTVKDRHAFSMQELTKDVIHLIEYLGLTDFSLSGISLGAAITLKVALKQVPGLQRLILVRPAWINERSPTNLDPLLTIADMIEIFGLDQGIERWRESEPHHRAESHSQGLADSLLGQFRRQQAGGNPIVFPRLIHDRPFDQIDVLHQIEQSTLILTSKDDPLHPLEHGRLIAGTMHNTELHEFPSKYRDPEYFQKLARETASQFLSLG